MGKEEGCWLQGRGAAACPGLGLSSQGPGMENNEGTPSPPPHRGVAAGGSFLFPQACSFVCVFIGGSREFFCLLLFPFFFCLAFG